MSAGKSGIPAERRHLLLRRVGGLHRCRALDHRDHHERSRRRTWRRSAACAKSAGVSSTATKEHWAAIRAMPSTMRQLAWVQLFTWLGLFCMWLYFPVAVARNVLGAADEKSPLFREGIEWAGVCFAVYSAVTFLFSLGAARVGRPLRTPDHAHPLSARRRSRSAVGRGSSTTSTCCSSR